MRILLVTDDFLPHRGGSRIYYHQMIRHMPEHEWCVLTRARAGDEAFDAKQSYAVRRVRLEPSGLLLPLRLQHLPIYWNLRSEGQRAIAEFSPELVVAGELVPAGVVAVGLAKHGGTPLVAFTHAEGPTTLSRTRVQSRLARWVCGRADAVVAASDNAATGLHDLLGVPNEKIAVVRPGVGEEHFDERFLCSGSSGDACRLLTVGRLIGRKGHAVVLDALHALRGDFPNVRYTIVGVGPDGDRLRAKTDALGLQDIVHFRNELDEASLFQSYADHDLFVLPNSDDPVTGDTEGFVITFGEAAAHGLPVVGGRGGGTGESIAEGETGFRVDGRNAQEVEAVLRQLIGSPDLRASMGRGGRERAMAQMRWSQRVQELGRVFAACVGGAHE